MGDANPSSSTPKDSGILLSTPTTRTWWKEGPVYQIWPASYKDSNNDGMGDVPGIISTLPYLHSLGIKIIWICPIYDSPQIDMGYDISSYERIYAPYGTVADVEVLLAEAHKLGMRVIFDLVINHTSHLHEWFQESRKSKENPKRDWYYWRPAKYNSNGERRPPNNWRCHFGESAWEWDENTQEYYLHLFTTEQPDLNWENEETRKAIYETSMKFWLDKGVDGFRIDTCNMYSKDPLFPDAKIVDPSVELQRTADFCNGPRMHEFLQEMYKIFEKYDCMTVGELPHTPSQAKVLKYVSEEEKQLNMVFNFEIVDLGMRNCLPRL
jgi:oligo-1,6-glucosidase